MGTETKTLEAELLLSAVGRAPVTEDIGLDKTNIKTDRGFIKIDDDDAHHRAERLRHRRRRPHADAGARGLAPRASSRWSTSPGRTRSRSTTTCTPSATYCYPEVASVGLTEKKAKERGYDVKVGIFPFSAITKASISDEGDRHGEDRLGQEVRRGARRPPGRARTPPSCSPRPASRCGWRPPPRSSRAPCTRTRRSPEIMKEAPRRPSVTRFTSDPVGICRRLIGAGSLTRPAPSLIPEGSDGHARPLPAPAGRRDHPEARVAEGPAAARRGVRAGQGHRPAAPSSPRSAKRPAARTSPSAGAVAPRP